MKKVIKAKEEFKSIFDMTNVVGEMGDCVGCKFVWD